MLTATASYKLIVGNMPRSLQMAADRPDVSRQAKYYLETIGSIKSVDEFLKNERVYRFAMKAFGLEEMSYAKAFMRKVLEGGIESEDSFANKLSDKRYRDFAEAFNFASFGGTATTFERAQQGTVDKYYRQVVEEDAGASDEGVRLALYFERKAPTVTSMYGLLADPALLKVAQTMAGLPEASGALDIDKQAALLGKRFKIEDFQDPEKLSKMLTRFTAMWEVQKAPTVSTSASALFGGASFGISGDLLASIQNLRLGGN